MSQNKVSKLARGRVHCAYGSEFETESDGWFCLYRWSKSTNYFASGIERHLPATSFFTRLMYNGILLSLTEYQLNFSTTLGRTFVVLLCISAPSTKYIHQKITRDAARKPTQTR